MNFSIRSQEKELLDGDGFTREELFRNLYELEVVNRWLGGFACTARALDILFQQEKSVYNILDLGSGGGDMLRFIARYARKKNKKVILHGVDILPDAIEYANRHSRDYSIHYHCADAIEFQSDTEFDLAYSSLFCHHLYEADLQQLLAKKLEMAPLAFVNDLHRHPLAYGSIALLTTLFSKSRLVKNDARLSVARAFSSTEMKALASQYSSNFELKWIWAFRWMLLIKRDDG